VRISWILLTPLLLITFGIAGCDESNNMISIPEEPGSENPPKLPC